MDWTTLISVVIGGLIATIPIFINNWFQARERGKERDEARKEAKTQVALELTRNDIRVLEEAIDNSLRGIGEWRRIRVKYSQSNDAENKIISEIRLKIAEEDDFFKLSHLDLVAEKLAHSLGDDFYSEYKSYISMVSEFLGLMLSPAHGEKEKELTMKLAGSSGKLHTMLAEKLISIRDI